MQRIALAFAAAYIPLWALVVARHAPSAAAETAPSAFASPGQEAEEQQRSRSLHLQVPSRADGSPLAGASVWVRRPSRPYSNLGGYNRRRGAVHTGRARSGDHPGLRRCRP